VHILVVKTSSMGDVVHATPAISDIAAARPDARIDWVVEAPFAAIPALHPAVTKVRPLAWRKWRKRLFMRDTWQAMAEFRRDLRAQPYDLVLDLQGLVKSALWATQARGPRAGYDRRSIWEPLASSLYDRVASVPKDLHAIDRCRRLAAAHVGYALPSTPPRFGLVAPTSAWMPANANYAVLIPGASRPEKLWPEPDWVALGQRLAQAGLQTVVFWGSAEEQGRAQRIAEPLRADVPPFLSVHDAAGVLGHARIVVGLDTGFSHLAAALGVATLGIFCDHEPSQAGITGDGFVRSLGGVGQVPALSEVLAQVSMALRTLAGATSD
jgi:heptosyltransferase-1